MRLFASLATVLVFSGVAAAQESVRPERLGMWIHDTDTCNALYGNGRDQCLADRYRMQQDDQLREQQLALQRAQEENQRLHNELLRRELARPAVATSVADFASIPGFAGWQAENRWFGSDRARTEYALLYARDLRQEQPELAGRPFLNALSSRVKEVFAPARH